MSFPEYYDIALTQQLSASSPLPLERQKKMAVDKLNGMASRFTSMDMSDPLVKEIYRSAQHAIEFTEFLEQNNYSTQMIYTYAKEAKVTLESRLTEYDKSKAENKNLSTEYSRVSHQFDAKLKNSAIKSGPLDFSRAGKPSSSVPSNGPGINETQLRFPSKRDLVGCVKKNYSAQSDYNPYLRDEKVVEQVAGSLAGKKMNGLDFKNAALDQVGKMRKKGDLVDIEPSEGNMASLSSMYEVFGKCALNKPEPQPKVEIKRK